MGLRRHRSPKVWRRSLCSISKVYSNLSLCHLISTIYAYAGVIGGSRGRASQISAQRVLPILDRLKKSPNVHGLVVAVQSPGGSPVDSDLIWAALRDFGRFKPVAALIRDVGASGGYYVAMAAHRVIAHEASITGSIGVLALRPDISGLLRRFGVYVEHHGVESAGRDGGSLLARQVTRPMNEREKISMEQQVDAMYMSFVTKAAHSRGMTVGESPHLFLYTVHGLSQYHLQMPCCSVLVAVCTLVLRP